jgi:hypothetical protein
MVSLEDHLLAIVRPGLHPWLCSGLPVQRAGQVGPHSTRRAEQKAARQPLFGYHITGVRFKAHTVRC